MLNSDISEDLTEGMQKALEKARLKFLEKKAKEDGVVIISDKDGNIKEVPAKELLLEAQKKSK